MQQTLLTSIYASLASIASIANNYTHSIQQGKFNDK